MLSSTLFIERTVANDILHSERTRKMTTPEDIRQLLQVAEWTMQNHYQVMSALREQAGSEEQYLIIARELDRVRANNARARSLDAESTLTLVDWLVIVDSYDWKCAYCQEKPFEVMHHRVQIHVGGTTVSNCLPACRGCCTRGKKRAPDQAPVLTPSDRKTCRDEAGSSRNSLTT
jgi:hypothetical protein